MKIIKINKSFRNGDKTHYLVILDERTNEGIEYEVEEWASSDLSGSNYGYTIKWEFVEDELEIQSVLNFKIKLLEDKISRLTDETEKMKLFLK